MEFKDILHTLRLNAQLTQEQLAEKLFVSRVTVSKWETGRGYPNLDSLKLISKLFSVSIDELLLHDQLSEKSGGSEKSLFKEYTVFFGGLDFLTGVLLFLPIFVNRGIKDKIVLDSLLAIHFFTPAVKWILIIFVSFIGLFGIIELVLHTVQDKIWIKRCLFISVVLSVCCEVLFILTLQQTPALIVLIFMVIKIQLLRKVSWM